MGEDSCPLPTSELKRSLSPCQYGIMVNHREGLFCTWALCGMETDLSISRNAMGPQRKAGVITAESVGVQGWGGEKQLTQVQVESHGDSDWSSASQRTQQRGATAF